MFVVFVIFYTLSPKMAQDFWGSGYKKQGGVSPPCCRLWLDGALAAKCGDFPEDDGQGGQAGVALAQFGNGAVHFGQCFVVPRCPVLRAFAVFDQGVGDAAQGVVETGEQCGARAAIPEVGGGQGGDLRE